MRPLHTHVCRTCMRCNALAQGCRKPTLSLLSLSTDAPRSATCATRASNQPVSLPCLRPCCLVNCSAWGQRRHGEAHPMRWHAPPVHGTLCRRMDTAQLPAERGGAACLPKGTRPYLALEVGLLLMCASSHAMGRQHGRQGEAREVGCKGEDGGRGQAEGACSACLAGSGPGLRCSRLWGAARSRGRLTLTRFCFSFPSMSSCPCSRFMMYSCSAVRRFSRSTFSFASCRTCRQGRGAPAVVRGAALGTGERVGVPAWRAAQVWAHLLKPLVEGVDQEVLLLLHLQATANPGQSQ